MPKDAAMENVVLDGWMIGGIVGTAVWTNLVMVMLKCKFPSWNKKAWAPPLIGAVTAVLGALVADQIHTWTQLTVWAATGLGAGSTASSGRDVAAGK